MHPIFSIALFVTPPALLSLVGAPHPLALGLLLSVMVAWLTETIPIGATALLIPTLGVLYGLVTPKEAFAPFGSEMIFLLIATFLLARAFDRSGLGRRIAFMVLSSRLTGGSLRGAIYALTALCWLTSMWMTNAAACSLFLPIVLGLLQSTQQFVPKEKFGSLSKRLLFLCSVTPGLGGLCTPVGALPNVLTFSYLAEHGHSVTILQWIGIATPISLALVMMSVAVLDLCFPIPTILFSSLRNEIIESRKQLGKIKRSEIFIALAFALLIALWLLPSILAPLLASFPTLASTLNRLTPTIAALLVVIPLFMLNASSSSDEKLLLASDLSAVDLAVILLFGGGLALGAIIESAGVAVMLSSGLSHIAQLHPAFIGFLIAALTLLISEFCSNTGAVALMLPIAFSIASLSGVADDSTLRLAFITVCAGTLGFSMPAGTPPNALVYATGKVSVRDIAWAGVWIDISGVLLVMLVIEWIYPFFRVW